MEYGILALLSFGSEAQKQPLPLKSEYSNVLKIQDPLLGIIAKPKEVVVEKPKAKELTLEEKINLNVNNCNDTQWIRADNAECIDKPKVTSSASSYVRSSGVAGNTYSPGYCTWYAKNMRPDLPNNLGNADTWVARAAAQGLPTGSEPRVGAIGQQGMHVVYVEAVDGDMVTISEMNYHGLWSMNTRTVSASSFSYIY